MRAYERQSTTVQERIVFLNRHERFNEPFSDGINLMPHKPGTYFILNRVNSRRYVGSTAASLRKRCLLHRSELRRRIPLNMLLRRDVLQFGPDAFCFFPIDVIEPEVMRSNRIDLGRLELERVIQMQSYDEHLGYNQEAGHVRTAAAIFREYERRQLGDKNYCFLPGIDRWAPISTVLLDSWLRGR